MRINSIPYYILHSFFHILFIGLMIIYTEELNKSATKGILYTYLRSPDLDCTIHGGSDHLTAGCHGDTQYPVRVTNQSSQFIALKQDHETRSHLGYHIDSIVRKV